MLIRTLFLSLVLTLTAVWTTAQTHPTHLRKSTFTDKDIFHSSVFLKNDNIVDNQTGEDIRYFVRHDHIKAYFTDKGIIYELTSIKPGKGKEGKKEESRQGKNDKGEEEESVVTCSSVFRMDWIGANPHPQIVSGEKTDGYYTYLKKAGNSSKTLTAYGYKSITYKNLYPGIDIIDRKSVV